MSVVDKALETQIRNLQTRTGKTLDELYAVIRKSGLTKHGEIRDMRDLGMGHGAAAVEEVNSELPAWIRQAYDSAG